MSIGISKIQRWVDRLAAACDQKKWAVAVSEADCLTAEIKLVREKLWENAEYELTPNTTINQRFSKPAVTGLKVLLSALIIICCTTIPIAMESEYPVASVPVQKNEEVLFVSSEEKELLAMLREDLSSKNAPIIMTEKKIITEKKENRTAEKTLSPQEDIIKTEDLITLVQIGQRSLMGNAPAIKIIQ